MVVKSLHITLMGLELMAFPSFLRRVYLRINLCGGFLAWVKIKRERLVSIKAE
jgi:hypothetical protein